jgi:hypothetical protein
MAYDKLLTVKKPHLWACTLGFVSECELCDTTDRHLNKHNNYQTLKTFLHLPNSDGF